MNPTSSHLQGNPNEVRRYGGTCRFAGCECSILANLEFDNNIPIGKAEVIAVMKIFRVVRPRLHRNTSLNNLDGFKIQ